MTKPGFIFLGGGLFDFVVYFVTYVFRLAVCSFICIDLVTTISHDWPEPSR